MSIQLQTRKQGSRMLDPWDDDDMETPRKFSLSVDSTDGASGKKLQRKKKGTVNPRLRNSTARSSNLNQKDFNVREKKARQTKPPVPSFDDRENQPVRNNGNATPVGTQWSQHNKARPSYATVSVAETNTIRNAMPEMPERGVSAETRRTQEQLGSMMTFFQNSGSAGNQIVQSAGQENAQRTPMSVAQEEIHREITIKPWNSSPTQTGPAARTSSDSRKSSPVVAIVSRTKPKHHPAAEVDGVSEVTSADSSHTGTPAAPKSAQLQRLRADLDAERSRADAAEASVERLAAQILQRDRIAHVSNSPEPKHRSNSLMSSGSTDALEKLQAQILKNKNSDLELLVQDLMRENQELRAQQEKFMDSYEHNEQSVDRRRGGEAQAQIDQLRDQLSRQRQDFKAREAQLQSTQSEMREKHQDELQKQCSLLEKSHQECTDLRAAVQQLAAATAQDRARCRQLENQAVTQDGAVEETRALNQKLHDQQQKLRERCLALEVRLAEANKRVERATQEAESNHRKAENLSTHLMETKQAYTKIMSRVADLEQHNSQNDAQSAMIEGLQQQLMDTKQRLFAEEKRSTDLEIHCRELMARLKALAAREQEPSSMDRTSLSPSNDENHKIVASNAVGECMALRRQVQVLTRQVTELEEANTQLALIKTTQILEAQDPSSNYSNGQVSKSKQIVEVNFAGQSQREVNAEPRATQSYSAAYFQRPLAAPRGGTLQQHQPQPFAWAKSGGSNTRWQEHDASSSSSSSFKEGEAHFSQAKQVQSYAQRGSKGYDQFAHSARQQQTATTRQRQPLQAGSWTYDSAPKTERSSAVSNSNTGGALSVQDFWRQQHPAFNTR